MPGATEEGVEAVAMTVAVPVALVRVVAVTSEAVVLLIEGLKNEGKG